MAKKKAAKKKATKKKHIRLRQEGKPQGLCVVLMPFSKEFLNQWELAVKPAIQVAGLEACRADESPLTVDVMKGVAKSIFGAELLIADLTGNNPNVFYELGLAQAIGKRVIIICQDVETVPHDLQSQRFLKYDPDNITKLGKDLEDTIKEVMDMKPSDNPEPIFSDLKLMDSATKRELEYLRRKAKAIKITAYPPTADLFFNDQLLGTQPQTILANKDYYHDSTISASSVLYFEEHRLLTEDDLTKEHIHFVLNGLPKPGTKKRSEEETKQASGYIRWKGKSPDNPALMRAVSHYLLHIKAYKEAQEEANELVKSANNWYLAHNQAGHVATRKRDYDAALWYFEFVRFLHPDSVIGYYNLACVYSLLKKFDSCLDYLQQILTDPVVLETYCYLPFNLVAEDSDFANIKKDGKHKKKFKSIAKKLRNHWNDFESKREDKETPQTLKRQVPYLWAHRHQ